MLLYNGKNSSGVPERPEIEYPCTWVYKVIGADCSLLKDIIVAECAPHAVKITHSNTSSKGKYHSLNAELEVASEEIRLAIYDKLQSNPAVKLVL
ncbi:MAG: HP0495 family protein [Desulforhopalus sp.]